MSRAVIFMVVKIGINYRMPRRCTSRLRHVIRDDYALEPVVFQTVQHPGDISPMKYTL